jgi:hypothetical protein
MRFLGALVTLLALEATAAEVTRVASSFEDNHPFGMILDVTFDRVQDKGKIVREWYQQDALQDVSELRYSLFDTRLPLDVHIGVFRDVELHIGVPIVFQQDRSWAFAQDTTSDTTTLYRNCSDARGNSCADPGHGTGHLFEVPAASFRSGLADFMFGLAWAPYNQKKDDTKPTWVLRFDYQAPTASVLNPSTQTLSSARGNIGDRAHRFIFATAVSKRFSVAEPYFKVDYTLPIPTAGSYSNCDDASSVRMGHPENCGLPGWARADTGLVPAHVGTVAFGSELTVFERPDRFQRVAFDLRAMFGYVSESRSYNELSDTLGKLLWTSDFAQAGGQVGFIGQAAEFVTLKAYASLLYNTEHYLTNETIGKDLNNNGAVDITASPNEINPNYDDRIDRAGRRFRMQEQFVFRIQVTASFNF